MIGVDVSKCPRPELAIFVSKLKSTGCNLRFFASDNVGDIEIDEIDQCSMLYIDVMKSISYDRLGRKIDSDPISQQLGDSLQRLCSAAHISAGLDNEIWSCPELPSTSENLDVIVMRLTSAAAIDFVRAHRGRGDLVRKPSGKRWLGGAGDVCLITRDANRRAVFEARAVEIIERLLVL